MAKATNTESYDAYIASYYIDEKEGVIHYLSVEEEFWSVVSCSIERVELTPIMLEQVLEVLHDQHGGEPEPSLEALNSIHGNFEKFFNDLYVH